MNESDQKLAERAKQAFDRSVDSLDAATLSRLNRGRQAALASQHRASRQWLRLMPATGVAAAVVITVFALRGTGEMDVIGPPADDLEILLGDESIEMLEDLEFYSWLGTQDLDVGDVG